MVRFFALALAACFYLQPGITFAQDAAKQLVGTWKLTSAPSKFDGGDTIEGFGPNPKGRLVLTSDGHWIIIITRADVDCTVHTSRVGEHQCSSLLITNIKKNRR